MKKSDVETNQMIRKLNLLCRAQDLELKKRESFYESLIELLNSNVTADVVLQDARLFISQSFNPFPSPQGTSPEDLDKIFAETFEDCSQSFFDDEILPFEQSETMTEVSLPLENHNY